MGGKMHDPFDVPVCQDLFYPVQMMDIFFDEFHIGRHGLTVSP